MVSIRLLSGAVQGWPSRRIPWRGPGRACRDESVSELGDLEVGEHFGQLRRRRLLPAVEEAGPASAGGGGPVRECEVAAVLIWLAR